MAQEFYTDSSGQHRWRVVGQNGFDILGDSGEAYVRKIDAVKGLLALVEAVNTDELRSYINGMEERGGLSN